MIHEFLIGSAIIFISIVVQALFVGGALAVLEHRREWAARHPRILKVAMVVGAIALWLMIAHSVAVWMWAIAFYALSIFPDLDTSVYFAAVSFTTLGFGDIIPPLEWRQLAGLCAANGLLVFGVSAAVLVEVLRQLGSDRD
ncbi:MAG: potassium channel family protein [Neomegalonema sp.]|nr:potassium channel family protein [Neomegalonema sp.]